MTNASYDDQFDCSHTFSFDDDGYLDVKLARPVYLVGSTVSVSIHCNCDVRLIAVGVARLDPRWQNSKSSLLLSPATLDSSPISLPKSTYLFWKTETVACESVPRPMGLPYRPPPIVLPTLPSPPLPDGTTTSTPEKLAIVQIQLPANGPPTLIATSCRYYYSLVVEVAGLEKAFEVPIPVILTSVPTDPIEPLIPPQSDFPSIRVDITDTAHLLTPTEREEFDCEWSVVQGPPRFLPRPPSLVLSDQDVPVCRLTFVTGFTLTPGAIFRCHAQRLHESCRQLSGHLKGREDAFSARARLYSWDTAMAVMQDTTSLSLHFPSDQVPMNTLEIRGVVKITAEVELDVVVEHRPGQFRILHADIPCHVTAPGDDRAAMEEADGEENNPTIRDLKVLGLATIKARAVFEEQRKQSSTEATEQPVRIETERCT